MSREHNKLGLFVSGFVGSIVRIEVSHQGFDAVKLLPPTLRASSIAAIVSAFGRSGSNGKALSCATRVSIRRTASDTVSPIVASTAEAWSFTLPLMRVCTSGIGRHDLISSVITM